MIAPSGTGKSTLLHIAGLLEAADEGDVIIEGQSIKELSEEQCTNLRNQKIGFVYQFHHLLPEFTALENVMMPLRIAGQKKKIACEKAQFFLQRLGLQDRLHNRPAELSGGEQQRVAIARALANDPVLLLADEPTGNLDPQTSQDVFALFLSLVREQNLSALIATHNHELARQMDRCVTLTAGKIVCL